MPRYLLAFTVIVALGATAFGETISVPKDFDTIQQAVDAAENGDVIKVKKGTYLETVEIGLLEDVTLKAVGKVVIDGEGTRNTLRIGLATNIRVIGVSVVNSVDAGILLMGTEGVVLQRCRVSDVGESGIVARSCRELTITDCRIERAEIYGVQVVDEVDAPASLSCVIEKCRFSDTGDASIQFESGSGHRAEKNRIDESGGVGIFVMTLGSTCAKNRISDARSGGITIFTNGGTVEKNRVKDCGSRSIYVFGHDATVTKNRLTAPIGVGYEIRGTRNLLEKNQVKAGRKAGFWLTMGGNTLIGNRAKKCAVAIQDDSPGNNIYEKNNFDAPPVP